MSTEPSTPLTLSPDTRVHDLIDNRPYLIDHLVELSPNYKALKNPVMRKTVGRVATLRRAAAMGSLQLDTLMTSLADRIRSEEGIEVTVETAAPQSDAESKQDELKALILGLHTGSETMESAKEKFQRDFGNVPAKDIAIMEQQLIQEGLPVEMIQELCDVHVGVMGGGATGASAAEQTPGHPVYTFVAENLALKSITAKTRQNMHELPSASKKRRAQILDTLGDQLALLRKVEKHYLRKENLLFPKLEREGFEGPSKVMWAIHDEIRAGLKDAQKALEAGDVDLLADHLPELMNSIDDMVTKEETILLPTSIDMLQHEDWADIYKQEEEIGFTLVQRETDWSPRIKMPSGSQMKDAKAAFQAHHPQATGEPLAEATAGGAPLQPSDANAAAAGTDSSAVSGMIDVKTGQLTLKQLDRMLLALPVELSFVDENDEVRYFTGVEDKFFPRSAAVIGRKVQNCHPPKSLHLVNKILEEMKAGTRETAQFWMDNFAGKFLFIRYDAVRDEDGTYLGCLEAVQDVTDIRKLEGSKRLLDEDE